MLMGVGAGQQLDQYLRCFFGGLYNASAVCIMLSLSSCWTMILS